ncbi:MAG: hypothetical protein P9M02_00250 [Candidatus Susulua stagnicola]|nr:hypothetical protein [Candidatus Susulua stagnicola]
MRNLVLGLLFLVFIVGVSGCQTVKGIGTGICGLGMNLAEDAKSTWSAIERADAWVEENYW